MKTLTEMREAAQSANEFNARKTKLVAEQLIECYGEGFHVGSFVEGARWLQAHQETKLADAVTQLCDEVVRLRAALQVYASKRHPVYQMTAQAALKESNKRFGD